MITDPATGDYTYTPNPDFNGSDTFTVIVEDGINPTVTVIVDVTVTPVNDAPVVIAPPVPTTLSDGQSVNVDTSTYFDDVDSPLTYSVTGLPTGLTFDPATGLISGTLPADSSQFGPYTVVVTATDGVNPPVNATLDVNVVNPAPMGSASISEFVNEGDLITIDVSTHLIDPDGDTLTWTSPDLPVWMTLDPATGQVMGTAPENSAADGPLTFTVTADDGQGGVTSITITAIPRIPVEPMVQTATIIPGEETFETTDLVTNTDLVDPIVADTVNDISDLNGTAAKDGVSGIIHDTVDDIDGIDATENADPVDPAVLEAVHAIEALRTVQHENHKSLSAMVDSWGVDGSTGFSLKFGYGEGFGDSNDAGDGVIGQLIIETYVRDRILFIDVNNTFDPKTQGTVKTYRVEMIDGSPVPDWIRIVRDGFIVIERPANLWDLELKISAQMENGELVSRGVRIDGPTGEIQPLKLADNRDSGLFGEQLKALANSNDLRLGDTTTSLVNESQGPH